MVRILVSSRRPCDSDALATSSYGMNLAQPLSEATLVSAAVSVVLPWSMCPMVPTFTCGLLRSNFSLAMSTIPRVCRVGAIWSRCPGSNWRPRPYQGRALPTELHRLSQTRRTLRAEIGAGDGDRTRDQQLGRL